MPPRGAKQSVSDSESTCTFGALLLVIFLCSLQRRVSQPEPEERLAWKAEMASTAGVYATFGIDREGALVAKQLLRGGQFMNKINPGDALMSVDGKPVDGMSIQEVRDMLVGPEGSQVQLEFWRRGQEQGSEGRMLVVNPYRTVTEAQEIQVGSTPPPLHVPRLYPARRPRAIIMKDQYRNLLLQLARVVPGLAETAFLRTTGPQPDRDIAGAHGARLHQEPRLWPQLDLGDS